MMRRMPTTAEMDRAFRARDTSYNGVFFTAVKTTGIFCAPSCPARKPAARNVEFFGTIQESLLAGYRPCKRCKPMNVDGRSPEWVTCLMARVESAPMARLRDADLRAMSVEPSRARRHFLRHYGMTFQAFHRARRLGLALKQLRKGADMDGVAWDCGYESTSGFRDAFARVFGEPPGRGRDASFAVARWMESPVGPLVAAATTEGVCLLEFADRRALESQLVTLRKRIGCSIVPGGNEHLDLLADELAHYFDGKLTRFTAPLVISGTPFQKSVWNRLLEIPYGETLSYEALARDVSRPGAQRAVGTANGANRIAIVIPCHRVVRKSGQLGGYGGGLWRKQHLLDHERAVHNATPDNASPPLADARAM